MIFSNLRCAKHFQLLLVDVFMPWGVVPGACITPLQVVLLKSQNTVKPTPTFSSLKYKIGHFFRAT